MKIQCDVCEKAPATIICFADEAALCAKCDVEVHAANKLASKHQRLLLQCLSNKLPRCDICQVETSKSVIRGIRFGLGGNGDKAAFIFCVEDRALFCQDCDEPIHSAGSLSANHHRFLATRIRVALSSGCNKDTEKSSLEPPNENKQQVPVKMPTQQASSFSSQWALDDFLHFSDPESSDEVRKIILFEVNLSLLIRFI
ncbi:B-box zinc finger protein 24-like [Fagus crenata]